MTLRISRVLKNAPQLKNPILIEGLPGIGNVGKIAVDFLVEELGAKKMMEINSFSFPNSVFVNDRNLVELPKVELYFKVMKKGKNDLLFLAGDVQPLDEEGSYEFSHKILDIAQELGVKQIITVGGIGLPAVPENPKVYCTSWSNRVAKECRKGTSIAEKLNGVVGPIIGVTGLIVGLAEERKMDAVCLLAETYGHPLYLGMKGSKEILKVLGKKLKFKVNLNSLDKDIQEIESELTEKTKQLSVANKSAVKNLMNKEVSYIG